MQEMIEGILLVWRRNGDIVPVATHGFRIVIYVCERESEPHESMAHDFQAALQFGQDDILRAQAV